MSGNSNSGRRPKPVELRVYEGNRSKTPLPEPPDYPQGVPICPEWMPALGREYWLHVVAEIGAVPGLLRLIDRGVLEQLCHAYHRLWSFTAYCEQHGYTYAVKVPYSEGGEENAVMWKKRPEAAMAKDASLEFARLRSELGMSPTARAKLAVPKPEKNESLLTG